MIDIKKLNSDFDLVAKKLKSRGIKSDTLNDINSMYMEIKNNKRELEELKAKLNQKSTTYYKLKKYKK